MPLYLHLSIHVLLSVLAGFLAFKMTGEKWYAIPAALAGGVLVDLDHVIDYFMHFGIQFDLASFLRGDQFSESGKIYIFFHAWEYVIIALAAYAFIKSRKARTLLLGLSLGLFLHLCADVLIDEVPLRTYSLIYRNNVAFALEEVTDGRCAPRIKE